MTVATTRRTPARPTLQAACARFVHRFTMEHVPAWARKPMPNGRFYAPQFRTDAEWYAATLFNGESPFATRNNFFTSGQTWPLGQSLETPFH